MNGPWQTNEPKKSQKEEEEEQLGSDNMCNMRNMSRRRLDSPSMGKELTSRWKPRVSLTAATFCQVVRDAEWAVVSG